MRVRGERAPASFLSLYLSLSFAAMNYVVSDGARKPFEISRLLRLSLRLRNCGWMWEGGPTDWDRSFWFGVADARCFLSPAGGDHSRFIVRLHTTQRLRTTRIAIFARPDTYRSVAPLFAPLFSPPSDRRSRIFGLCHAHGTRGTATLCCRGVGAISTTWTHRIGSSPGRQGRRIPCRGRGAQSL